MLGVPPTPFTPFTRRPRLRALCGAIFLLGGAALVASCGSTAAEQATTTPNPESDLTEVVEPDVGNAAGAQATATVIEPAATAGPTPTVSTTDVVDTGDAIPRYWRVTGVDDVLNVRSSPGTDAPIVGTINPTARGIVGLGPTAEASGRAWTEIDFDDGSATYWVASEFLAPDVAPGPVLLDQQCFLGIADFGRVAAIIGNDNGALVGVIRTEGQGDLVFYELVDGAFTSPTTASGLTVDELGNEQSYDDIVVGDPGLTIGPRSIPPVDCDEIAGWVNEMIAVRTGG